MKLNKKGFMLAEVVVVSVVIATTLVTLYVALNRLISAFDTRSTYYDVDAAYLAVEVNNILINNGKINELNFNGNSKELFNSDINNILNYYQETSSIYFSLYDKEKIKIIKNEEINQTFKDYIDYLNGNLNYEEPYTYVIISEMCKTDDDCRYYTLKVR